MADSVRLASLCEAIIDCPHSTPVWTESGVVVLRNQNIRNGRLDLSDPSFTDEDHYRGRTRRATPTEGDLVITREAPMGEACMIPTGLRCCLGQRMVLLRPDKTKTDPRYLLYALQSPSVQHEIRTSDGTGSTVSNLRIPHLEALPIPIRSLEDQTNVGRVLGTLDDKIQLNLRMNEALDALARTLFERDVTMAEQNGSGSVGALRDHLDVARGLSYTGAGLGSGLPLHNLNSIREGGGYKRDGIKYYSGEYHERHTVRFGDVIVANTEQGHDSRLIGYPAIVPRRFGEVGLFSQDTYRVRPKPSSPLTHAFIYLLLRSEPLRSTVAGYANGTTVNHLPAEALARPTFSLPPAERVRALDQQVSPLLAKIEANEDENETLAALRDTLLPKLVSGELRVRDAEAVAAAT